MSVPPEPPPAVPPSVPPPAAYAYPPAVRTNGFAVASLVCSIATIVFCGIGTVLGIVFGHIARHQIKRSGEGGGGLALAGLIIGYATIALGALVIAGLILLTSAFDGTNSVVDHARDVDVQIVRIAGLRGTTPRDRAVIDQAFTSTCCVRNVTLGATGVRRPGASNAELALVNWRLDIEGVFGGHACLTVPADLVVSDSDVSAGRC